MAVGVNVVLVGLAQRADAVFEHRPAIAKDQGSGQTAVVILARHDIVAAFLGEEAEPFVVFRAVEQRAVFGEEVVNRSAVEGHRTAPAGSMPSNSA